MTVTRMDVLLGASVADTVAKLARREGITVTELVRRAIALWRLVCIERARGNRVMVVDGHGEHARFREIVLR